MLVRAEDETHHSRPMGATVHSEKVDIKEIEIEDCGQSLAPLAAPAERVSVPVL